MNKATTVLAGLWLAATAQLAGQPKMDMVQTLSDQAQGMTIAFDGLAFLTGSLGADSFLPPGKVADFSGFQYLRDNDPTKMGHNTDFVTIIARNLLNLMSDSQTAQLVARARNQVALINEYGSMRFPLMDAFRRRLTGSMPEACTELDLAAVQKYSGELYYLDGLISLDRAMLFGDILRNMTSNQLSTLNHLATLGGVGNWPQDLADPLQNLHLDPDISVGVMTYASEMYSWYAGSVEADTYFCPERQGTYFGSFYLKDAPAMGNPNYSIDTNLTADSGNAFLDTLNPSQRQMVTNLVSVQKPYLYELVSTRSNIAVQLRQLMVTNSIDTNAVLDLCYHYGELDGMIIYSYATHFAQVKESLSTNQQAALAALRLKLLGKDLLYPAGAYLYSAPIAMPAIANTDFLFGAAITNRFALPDTGQTQSYTSTWGEDSDYVINHPSLTDHGDGTVTDNVTGLVWQQADGGEMTWEMASSYAQTNRVGNQSDWRLPTARELFGIMNHGMLNPALDTNVFTLTAAEHWWTSEADLSDSNRVWVVNAGGGLGPHPKNETLSAGGAKRFHVRCVRGALSSSQLALRFTRSQDGTITDHDTGLIWQQGEDAGSMSWETALTYAENLTLAGHTDWRLPNLKELQSLNDAALRGPSINTNYFPAAQPERYWSSTTEINDTNRAWFVDFQLGIVSYVSKLTNLLVRCVRSSLTNSATSRSVAATGASLAQLVSGLNFTESPAADSAGNLCFSDLPSSTIYQWSVSNQLAVLLTNSGAANGLAFDGHGNLIACAGESGAIVSLSPSGSVSLLASNYAGLRFNEPNDLWVDPTGGVYFTDPVYFHHAVVQGGEHVYYLSADRSAVVRVVTDMIRPNGLVGTPDGKLLYLADWGASNVFRYAINADGTLTNKTLFAKVRCDGMTLDAEGNLYLCENAVLVYSSGGSLLEKISVPERPTNVEFGGSDRKTLFITTDGGSLFALRMRVQGTTASSAANPAPVISHTTFTSVASATNETAWVTALITNPAGIAGVTLSYLTGTSGSNLINAVFQETMRPASVKPWAGDGCNNDWLVTFAGNNPFEQRDGANYGGGNTNGAEFKGGTINLADSMLAPAQTIDARGSSASVEFAMWTDGLSGSAGWTFQLDAGSGFETRLSELTGTNHNWQVYHYNLQNNELVSNLKLRWQFRGGQDTNRIDLDQILVRVLTGDTSNLTNVAMLDDGQHHDGTAGDGIYGTEIPTLPIGTTINYYVTAVDVQNRIITDPPDAPGNVHYHTALPGNQSLCLRTCQMTPSGVQLGWLSVPDRDYVVLHKAALNASAWTRIATNHSVGALTIFTDNNALRLIQPQGFYRVIVFP
jgi:sugar lactone lactonase YvrE